MRRSLCMVAILSLSLFACRAQEEEKAVTPGEGGQDVQIQEQEARPPEQAPREQDVQIQEQEAPPPEQQAPPEQEAQPQGEQGQMQQEQPPEQQTPQK